MKKNEMKQLYSSPSVKCIRVETEHLLDGGSDIGGDDGNGKQKPKAKGNSFFEEDEEPASSNVF